MIRTYLTRATSANIRESECRLASQNICFPDISSCITITLVNTNIMIGLHLTIADKVADIRKALVEVKNKIGDEFSDCYIIGALSVFKKNVFDRSICTRTLLAGTIKSQIIIGNDIKFHDTGVHLETKKSAHIFIRNNPFSVSYSAAYQLRVSGQEPPLSVGRKHIPCGQFSTIKSVGTRVVKAGGCLP